MDVPALDVITMLAMVIAVAVSAFISSVTGMAGGVLMFAALNTVIPLRVLVPIHGVVQLFNNAARSIYLWRHIRWAMCIPFTLGALIGAGVTTLLLIEVVGEFFPLLLLLLLICYTLFRPKRMPAIQLPDHHYFWVGIATGFMGILVGAVDPILAVFFVRRDLSKEEIVGNKSLMQFVTHLIKVPAYMFLGFVFLDHAEFIAILTLAGMVGVGLGIWALKRIRPEIFMLLMKTALGLAGIRICYQLASIGLPY